MQRNRMHVEMNLRIGVGGWVIVEGFSFQVRWIQRTNVA